jgi:cell division protein FtsQ
MKKFWRILKKILTIASVLFFATLFVVVLTSAIQKQNQLTCKQVQVKIDYDSGVSFLNENGIKDDINYLAGGNVIAKGLAKIDFNKLEKGIEKNPFIDNAEIFVDQQQNIIIDITQKRPILRILNKDGVGYYLSEKNERIPLSDNFTPHVAIALGSVQLQSPKRDSSVQIALYKLIQYVRKDKFLDALVDQIYVTESGEFEIIPKIQGHFIRFGNGEENIEEKFNRLKIFYKEGMTRVGWTKYKSIDLRYMNQVVCERRDSAVSIINNH